MLARGILRPARRFTSTLSSLQTAVLSQDFVGAGNTFQELQKDQVKTADQQNALFDTHRKLLKHYKEDTSVANLDNILRMEKKLYKLNIAPYSSIVAALDMAIKLNEPEKGVDLWVSYLEALGSRTLTPIKDIISKGDHLNCSLLALTCYFKACKNAGVEASTTAASSLVPLKSIPAIARAVKLAPEDLEILEEGLRFLRSQRQDFGSDEYIHLIRIATNEEVNILYIEAMERDNVPEAVYAEFIRRFGETRQTSKAIEVWNAMVKSGVTPTVTSWNGLLRATAMLNVDALSNFEGVWNKMCKSVEPDAQSYGTKIACLGRNGKYAEALEEFNDLRKNHKEKIDIFVVNNMLNILLKQKLFDSAISLLSWSNKNGITPNVVSYNNIIKEGLEADTDLVSRVLDEMQGAGIAPDIVTWSQALQNIFKQGIKHRIDVLDRVNEIVKGVEASSSKPNAQFWTILADGLSKTSHDIKKVREIYDRIIANNLRIQIQTFGAFIEAELRHGSVQRALEIFNSMKNYGHPPNVPTYTQMIDGALKRGEPEVALSVWKRLNESTSHRVAPTVWTYMFILNQRANESAAYRELLKSAIDRLCKDKELTDYRLANNIMLCKEAIDIPEELEDHAKYVLANELDMSKASKSKNWRR